MTPAQRNDYPELPAQFSQFTGLIDDYGAWRLLTNTSGDSYAAQFRDGSLLGLYEAIGPRAGKVTDYQGNQFSRGEAPAWNWYDRRGRLMGSSLGVFDRLPESGWEANNTAAPEYWRRTADKAHIHLSGIHPAPVWTPTDGVQLWRNSRFGPDEIFPKGFQPKGRETPNLLTFVYESPKNTTYISLTTTENYVEQTATQSHVPASAMKDRWAYAVNLPHGAINVNATLDIASPFPDQQEYIVPGCIPSKYIEYAREIDLQTGALKAERINNPYYSAGGSPSIAQAAAAHPRSSQSYSEGSTQGPSAAAAHDYHSNMHRQSGRRR